jgi:hypothetical protein
MWTSFVVNQSPSNHTGLQTTFTLNTTLPTWQPYNPSQDNFLQIGVEDKADDGSIFMSSGYYTPKCDLWDNIITYNYHIPRCSSGFSLKQNGTYWMCV